MDCIDKTIDLNEKNSPITFLFIFTIYIYIEIEFRLDFHIFCTKYLTRKEEDDDDRN